MTDDALPIGGCSSEGTENGGGGPQSTEDSILLAAFNYVCQVPGKQIRTHLAKAFNQWLNIPSEKLDAIVEIVQMLHNASLMIDDIEDNSTLRRGLPVAHNIYGVPTAINAANYAYFLALQRTNQLGHASATSIYTEQLLELHRGQGMEIYWRDTITCPSEEAYVKMVARKTGGLFGLAVRLMQLFSANKADFTPLTDCLGVYFQIRDDYANICSDEYATQKTFCDDLTEGKFSFPIIHAVRSVGGLKGDQVLHILRQRPKDSDVKRYCVQLLEETGSLAYTREKLVELECRALDLVSAMGGNAHIAAVIEELRKVYRSQSKH